MKLHVNRELLQATTRCAKGFACLNGDESCLCHVADCVLGDVIFVEIKNQFCPYILHFGDKIICACPVRKDIYNKYMV